MVNSVDRYLLDYSWFSPFTGSVHINEMTPYSIANNRTEQRNVNISANGGYLSQSNLNGFFLAGTTGLLPYGYLGGYLINTRRYDEVYSSPLKLDKRKAETVEGRINLEYANSFTLFNRDFFVGLDLGQKGRIVDNGSPFQAEYNTFYTNLGFRVNRLINLPYWNGLGFGFIAENIGPQPQNMQPNTILQYLLTYNITNYDINARFRHAIYSEDRFFDLSGSAFYRPFKYLTLAPAVSYSYQHIGIEDRHYMAASLNIGVDNIDVSGRQVVRTSEKVYPTSVPLTYTVEKTNTADNLRINFTVSEKQLPSTVQIDFKAKSISHHKLNGFIMYATWINRRTESKYFGEVVLPFISDTQNDFTDGIVVRGDDGNIVYQKGWLRRCYTGTCPEKKINISIVNPNQAYTVFYTALLKGREFTHSYRLEVKENKIVYYDVHTLPCPARINLTDINYQERFNLLKKYTGLPPDKRLNNRKGLEAEIKSLLQRHQDYYDFMKNDISDSAIKQMGYQIYDGSKATMEYLFSQLEKKGRLEFISNIEVFETRDKWEPVYQEKKYQETISFDDAVKIRYGNRNNYFLGQELPLADQVKALNQRFQTNDNAFSIISSTLSWHNSDFQNIQEQKHLISSTISRTQKPLIEQLMTQNRDEEVISKFFTFTKDPNKMFTIVPGSFKIEEIVSGIDRQTLTRNLSYEEATRIWSPLSGLGLQQRILSQFHNNDRSIKIINPTLGSLEPSIVEKESYQQVSNKYLLRFNAFGGIRTLLTGWQPEYFAGFNAEIKINLK